MISVAAEIARTLTVSVPSPVFTVVMPAIVSSVTVSAPSFVFSFVVPACVLFTRKVSFPPPSVISSDSMSSLPTLISAVFVPPNPLIDSTDTASFRFTVRDSVDFVVVMVSVAAGADVESLARVL